MPIETVKKDNFLLVNDQQNNIVIFSCYRNLYFLCSVDCELAIHLAVQAVFPTAVIMGFLFHLTQAWYRKIQELSLSTEYKNKSSSVGKWLR
ncbi:unnamed protein product, partial [Tenebrio molitor]